MHPAATTQPLTSPWRHAHRAVRLRVALDRRAALVVEDEHTPVPQLDARVFEVERVARLALVADDGSVVEKRVVAGGDEFARRVVDIVEWATLGRAELAVELTHDLASEWGDIAAAVRALSATVDERVCRADIGGGDVLLDRRRRVA